jgi:hypothetical protein
MKGLQMRNGVVITALVAVAAGVVSTGVVSRHASAAEASGASGPALVGRWSRVTTCQDLVAALRKAGLGATAPAMIAGNGLVPGTPQELAQKADICSGARPRAHSHFFTAAGAFGSLDWKGQQVDDGPYRLIDSRTIRIGGAAFRYRITGKQLVLTPVITAAAKRKALAHPLEFSTAGWQVAVSFPGHSWKRVPCGSWC